MKICRNFLPSILIDWQQAKENGGDFLFEQKTVWEAKKLLSARTDGLTQKEVRERLGAYGPNELEE